MGTATGIDVFPCPQCQKGRFWTQLLSHLYSSVLYNERCIPRIISSGGDACSGRSERDTNAPDAECPTIERTTNSQAFSPCAPRQILHCMLERCHACKKKRCQFFVVLCAPSLTHCFYGGHGRRARPGNVVSMYMTHAASRPDPPYQFAWTVCISWIFVATAIVELETRRRHSPVSRNPRTFGRFSHSQAL